MPCYHTGGSTWAATLVLVAIRVTDWLQVHKDFRVEEYVYSGMVDTLVWWMYNVIDWSCFASPARCHDNTWWLIFHRTVGEEQHCDIAAPDPP